MPALRYCGRRWSTGSDDFVFVGLWGFAVNLVFAVALPLVFHLNSFDDCKHEDRIRVYLMISFGLHTSASAISCILASISIRGAPYQTSKRRWLKVPLTLGIICWVLLAGAAVWGSVVVLHAKACLGEDVSDRKWLVSLVVVQWVIVASLICSFLMHFDGNPDDPSVSPEEYTRYQQLWGTRCKLLCCCMTRGGPEDLFEEVGVLLAGVFRGLDLVPSDIAAGLILLHMQQQKKFTTAQLQSGLRNSRGTAEGVDTLLRLDVEACPLPPMTPEVVEDISTLVKYSKYFMAVYGWPLQMFAYPVSCATRILCCCSACGAKGVEDDNCCLCNTQAFLAETGLDKTEILNASFEPRFAHPVYVACVDHELESIVIAIRGTMSLVDCLTDACADVTPFGDVDNGYAHKGIAQSAKNILASLEAKETLAGAVRKYPNYKIVSLGHSLGAGTAALLSVLLRQKYGEKVTGLAYSPPGGLMSQALSEATKPYLIATSLGKDLVPRVSHITLYSFRNQLLEALGDARRPKACILGCCLCSRNPAVYLNTDGVPRHEDATTILSAYLERLGRTNSTTAIFPLYPPGRLVHLHRIGTDTGRACTPDRMVLYPVHRDQRDLLDGEGILASPFMVIDHLPNKVRDALLAVQEAIKSGAIKRLEGWGQGADFRAPRAPRPSEFIAVEEYQVHTTTTTVHPMDTDEARSEALEKPLLD